MESSLLMFQVDITEMRHANALSGPIIIQLDGITSVHRNDIHPKVSI
jgi:hypothetical protein